MGTISFDENPYIYYKDTWYSLGDSVEIKKGDGFWLYAKIRCTYDLASIAVTVRLLVDSRELGKKYTSINCHDKVTTVWAYCTADYSGTAKAELWLGDLNNLMETKSSWIIDFPAKKDTKLKCYDKTTDVNVKVTLEAKLEEAAFPYTNVLNGYVKFYMNDAYQGADYTDSSGKAYLDITPTASGTYTIKAVFASAGDYNGSEGTCTLTVTEPAKKDTKIDCYDKTTDEGVKVTLEAKLEEAAFPYTNVLNGYVKFYTATALIGGDYTDANGKAYVDYTPPTAGTFTITAVFSAAGDYNGSEGTCTLTVTEPAKKDTEIDDFDVKDIEGVPVRKLYVDHTYQWKAFLYEYKLVGHGDPIKGRKIKIKRVDTGALLFAGNTQTNGGIVGSWTAEDKHKGAYKVQAKFAGDSAYNSCESGKFDIEVIVAPERGVEVVVKNVPSEGLKVLIAPYGKLIPYVCAWSMKTEKTIYSDLESVMFDLTTTIYIGITKACIQVKNMADELMDELKAESIPTTGTATKHLNGYNGRPYRTWLGASPRTPAPGKSFTLTAHLIKNPKETVGKDFEVVFYEVVDEVEERIGANLTNEMGQAMFMTSKAEPGTYTYVSRYSGGDTFAEPTTVTVSAVPPCPIEEAFREVCPMTMAFGCVITPDLVTLRAFRDAVLPRIVVKAYYAAGPFIIILFVNNRASKWFIRKLVHIVAQRLRKRWSY